MVARSVLALRVLARIVVRSLLRSVATLAAILAAARASAQPAPGPLSDDRKIVNIASNPFSWAVGLYGLGVSVALHDRIALHVDTNYLQKEPGVSYNYGYELGLGVTLYARHAFSGPLIEPGVRFRRQFDHCDGCGDLELGVVVNSRTTMMGPELLVGWQWLLDSRFTVAIAVGPLYGVGRGCTTARCGPLDSAFVLDGYVRLGLAF